MDTDSPSDGTEVGGLSDDTPSACGELKSLQTHKQTDTQTDRQTNTDTPRLTQRDCVISGAVYGLLSPPPTDHMPAAVMQTDLRTFIYIHTAHCTAFMHSLLQVLIIIEHL